MGSVRQITEATGLVRYDTSYNPYGVRFEEGGPFRSSLGFTGEFADSDGLLFLRARYYAPTVRKFVSQASQATLLIPALVQPPFSPSIILKIVEECERYLVVAVCSRTLPEHNYTSAGFTKNVRLVDYFS